MVKGVILLLWSLIKAEEEEDDDDSGKKDAAMEAFNNLAGEDGEVSAYELKDILNGLFMEGMSEINQSIFYVRYKFTICVQQT